MMQLKAITSRSVAKVAYIIVSNRKLIFVTTKDIRILAGAVLSAAAEIAGDQETRGLKMGVLITGGSVAYFVHHRPYDSL
jgi:hypothetical protein